MQAVKYFKIRNEIQKDLLYRRGVVCLDDVSPACHTVTTVNFGSFGNEIIEFDFSDFDCFSTLRERFARYRN
jgi:hypothetical protein